MTQNEVLGTIKNAIKKFDYLVFTEKYNNF